MRWTESSSGGDWEQAPLGAQVARCIKLIDIGTQTGEYQGKQTHRRQVIVMWELPNCLMEQGEFAGKPFVVSKFYTASLSEKANLRHDLVAWRGREFTPEELAGFDAKNILGVPCMLGIVDVKGKSRVGTVMQLPRGMPVPAQINDTVYFSLDEFKQDVFDNLSKGIKAMVEKSPEYQAIADNKRGYQQAAQGLADMPDDIAWGEDKEDQIPF